MEDKELELMLKKTVYQMGEKKWKTMMLTNGLYGIVRELLNRSLGVGGGGGLPGDRVDEWLKKRENLYPLRVYWLRYKLRTSMNVGLKEKMEKFLPTTSALEMEIILTVNPYYLSHCSSGLNEKDTREFIKEFGLTVTPLQEFWNELVRCLKREQFLKEESVRALKEKYRLADTISILNLEMFGKLPEDHPLFGVEMVGLRNYEVLKIIKGKSSEKMKMWLTLKREKEVIDRKIMKLTVPGIPGDCYAIQSTSRLFGQRMVRMLEEERELKRARTSLSST